MIFYLQTVVTRSSLVNKIMTAGKWRRSNCENSVSIIRLPELCRHLDKLPQYLNQLHDEVFHLAKDFSSVIVFHLENSPRIDFSLFFYCFVVPALLAMPICLLSLLNIVVAPFRMNNSFLFSAFFTDGKKQGEKKWKRTLSKYSSWDVLSQT